MSPLELQSAIADLVNHPDYPPLKPRIIAKRLGLPKEEVADVRRMVKRMVKLGLVSYASNDIVRPVSRSQKTEIRSQNEIERPLPSAAFPNAENTDEERTGDKPLSDLFTWPELTRKRKRSEHARPRVIGVFHRTQKGFGFVRPTPPTGEEGELKAKDDPKADDIFVPAKYTLDAAGGDVVAVEVKEIKRPRRGIPTLASARVGGSSKSLSGRRGGSSGASSVARFGLRANRRQALHAADFRRRSGAKNARPDDKVVIEMIRFPSPMHDGEGVIVEVLGAQGQPGVDTLSIIREFSLPEEFAQARQTMPGARPTASTNRSAIASI